MSTAALAHDVKAAPPVRSGLKPLPVNRPGDVYEQEAERVAHDVVSSTVARPSWSLSKIGIAAPLQRECACGGLCEDCKKKKKPEQMLQRDAAGAASPMTAPPIVHDVLRGAGNPLDRSTRNFMESRFGHDFSGVRVFHDDTAARSARSVAANAYTVGNKIVFDQGHYAPSSQSGRQLLAHELAHVVQQGDISHSISSRLPIGPASDSFEHAADHASKAATQANPSNETISLSGRTTQAAVQRFPSYSEIKEAAYRKLIEGARATTRVSLNALRSAAKLLPASMQSGASTMIDIADVVIGAVFAVCFAVVGIIVGAGEGVADMVSGLVTLILGIGKTLFDIISGIFTNFDAAKQDWDAIVNAFKGLPGAVKKLVTDWLDKFEKAPSERQSLMIGELTGQLIALIGTFAIAAGRAGTVAKIAGETAEVTEAATVVADATATTGKTGAAVDTVSTTAKVARPALRVIEGGGQPAAKASSATRAVGNTALKIAPEVEQAPKFVPRIVPPPPVPVVPPVVAPVVTATKGVSATKAIVTAGVQTVAKGTKVATDPASEEKKKKKCEQKEPCEPLPIRWPSTLLPEPHGDLIRTKGDLREVEGTDRGPNQAAFARCISNWRKDPKQMDLEDACPGRGFYQDGLQPSENIDAHHIHPLYLGGGDDWEGNLGAVEVMDHRRGHRELDNQQEMFDHDPTWIACAPCSPNLSKHPVDQEYILESN